MADIDPGIRFPGESEEYRRARDRLLEAEGGCGGRMEASRRAAARAAAGRRRAGGLRLRGGGDGGEVRFSELFEGDKETLVIYSFMFPRIPARMTRTRGRRDGQLPLSETPCASCTSILDSLDGAAPHVGGNQPRRGREVRARAGPQIRARAGVAPPAAAVLARQRLQP